ncbi:hypothetical protein F5146DRAFT_605694 [Armillaria mellea]|nr:hypothetical protein F5146DRAFT_605694 [Armillaria mellea]
MSPNTSSTRAKCRSDSDKSGDDALKHLFNCRPAFRKLDGFKGSRDTRKPAHYDMHLHPHLTLKDITFFPDMLDQLAGAVDAKIEAFLSSKGAKHLPRVDKLSILHPKQVSKVLDKKETWVVSHEITLQTSYLNLQQYPALVASTLITGLDEWSTIFQYSEKPTVTTACAEADRYLSLNMSAVETAEIPEDLKTKLQLVVDKKLSDFLFWEFKSMNAGTMGVMLAIFHLTGSEFPWSSCPASKYCDSQFCQKKNNRFRFTVTGNKTGVDGAILENISSKDNSDASISFVFDQSKLDLSVQPIQNTRRWKFKKSKQPKKRARPEADANRHSTDVDDYNKDDVDVDDGDDDGEDGELNDDDDTLPFTEAEYHKALRVVQQIWAEAVSIDATFIVLSCANLEYIGIRDRKLQRLYLSPLLDLQNIMPNKPRYFKIHTGLEIVALLDAIERAERLDALPQDPELYTFEYDRSEPYEDKVSSNSPKTRRLNTSRAGKKAKKVNVDEDEDEEGELNFTPAELRLFHRLRRAHSLKLTWKQNVSGLGAPNTTSIMRTPARPAHRNIWTEEMELFVMARYPDSTISYACYVSDGETAVRGIVLKLAQFPDQEKGLQREYQMYTKLPMADGIVHHLGIVKQFGLYRQSHDNKTALVLLDGGCSISEKFGPGCTPATIYRQVCEAVKVMHSSRITHGALAPENILITRRGKGNKGKWVIHFIRWKNGKDHWQIWTVTRKVYDDSIIKKPKARCAKTSKAVNEKVKDAPLTEKRTRSERSKFGVLPKGKFHSVLKRSRRQRNKAVEADLRKLKDNAWFK